MPKYVDKASKFTLLKKLKDKGYLIPKVCEKLPFQSCAATL